MTSPNSAVYFRALIAKDFLQEAQFLSSSGWVQGGKNSLMDRVVM